MHTYTYIKINIQIHKSQSLGKLEENNIPTYKQVVITEYDMSDKGDVL